MGKQRIVTIKTKTGLVCLGPYASESARTYVESLVDAARRCKADPRDALINTDDYPALMKRSMVEFAIGWLHGCAESNEVMPEQLFDAALAPELATAIEKLKISWGLTKAPKGLVRNRPARKAA